MQKKNFVISLLFFIVCIIVAGSFAFENVGVAKAVTGDGGCMYVSQSNSLSLSNTKIKKYTATQNGGGIFVGKSGRLSLSNVEITNCTASQKGHGLYISNSATAEMTDGSISNNKKTSGSETASGGGIYLESDATFTMNSGNIQNNSARYGGGVYTNYGSTFNMKGGQISGNTATSSVWGGNVYNNGKFTAEAGQIGASGSSTYFYNGSSGTLTLKGSAVLYDQIDNYGSLNVYSSSCVKSSINLNNSSCYNIYCSSISALRSSFNQYIYATNTYMDTDFIVIHVDSSSYYDESNISSWVDSYVYLPDDSEISIDLGTDYSSDSQYKYTITVKEKKDEPPPTYPIYLENTDGKGASETIYRAYGDSYNISTPSATGFEFDGWYTKAGGSGTQVYSSDTFSSSSPTTLYAYFRALTYTIIMDPNGGSFGLSAFSYFYDESKDNMGVPTKSGYKFVGWYSSVSNTQVTDRYGNIYHFTLQEELNSLIGSEQLTVYAEWTSSSSMTYGGLDFDNILDITKNNGIVNTQEIIMSTLLKRKTLNYWLVSFLRKFDYSSNTNYNLFKKK